MMADIAKVKRNIQRMIDQGAQESEIDQYVASEGTTPDELKAHQSQPSAIPQADTAQDPRFAGDHANPQAGKTNQNPKTDYISSYNPYSPMAEGASFGGMDELTAGVNAPIASAINRLTGSGETGVGDNYNNIQAANVRNKALYQEQHPIADTVGQLAGGVLVPLGPAGKFIKGGGNIATRALRSGVVGGGIGGVNGFLATDGSLEDRVKGGGIGAATGAALGTALPPIFATSKAIIGAALQPIKSLANKEGFAASKVAEALQRDNLTTGRVASRLASNRLLKGDLNVADVSGSNSLDLLRAASNVPSKARQSLVQQLEYRQNNQLDRLQGDIHAAMGDATQFHKATETLVAGRKAAAAPMFDKAFQTPTPYTVELENVLKRPLTAQLVEKARIAAANRGEQFKNIFIDVAANGNVSAKRVIDTEGLHRVKMTIDEMIGSMKRGQETGLTNASIRDLTILKSDLMKSIQNPAYKSALGRYAGDSAMVNALDAGFEDGLTMDPELIKKTLSDLSPSEQKLWRMGFARKLTDTLRDQGRKGTNRAEILAAPKFMSRLEAAIPDKNLRRDIVQKIMLEQRMARTRNAVQGNSTTARQLAQGQEAGIAAEDAKDIMSSAKSLATGDVFGAAIKWLGRAKNTATGLRPAVADEIIRLITTKKPADIRAAQTLIARQAKILERKTGSHELRDGLRAIAAGLLSGKLGQAAAAQ